MNETIFVIPTYRLRDVAETIEKYDQHFRANGHAVKRFIAMLNTRLCDRKLESLVRNLFRPSYGGNRNYTLMYTLGRYMVSADDDMRPEALVENNMESLAPDEVCRGRLFNADQPGFVHKSFDVLTAFQDVLGNDKQELPQLKVRNKRIRNGFPAAA